MKHAVKYFMIVTSILFLLTAQTYAESNGIWHLAQDVRPGTFASDEDTSAFIFQTNLGIGGVSPVDRLHIQNGDLRLTGTSTDIRSFGPSNTDAYFFIESESTLGNHFDIGLYDTVNGFNEGIMRIDANLLALQSRGEGNVGIGTKAPTVRLQVDDKGPTAFVSTVASFNNIPDGATSVGLGTEITLGGKVPAASTVAPGQNTSIGSVRAFFDGDSTDGGGLLQLYTANTGTFGDSSPRLTIDENGNVGIGNINPQFLLDVIGGLVRFSPGTANNPTAFTGKGNSALAITGGFNTGQFARLTFGNDLNGNYGGIGLLVEGGGSSLYFGTSNDYTTGITNEAIVIDPDGQVGINDTSPSYTLEVGGKINARDELCIAGDCRSVWPGGGGSGSGLVGYEIVSNTEVSAFTATVSCSAGKVLVGGGCKGAVDRQITESYPLTNATWTCNLQSAATSLVAYGICVTP